MAILTLILFYLLTAIILDQVYNRCYFWDANCIPQRIATSLLQPLMEIFGNGMTAHTWHFEYFKVTETIDQKYRLDVCPKHPNKANKSFRKFNSNPILRILTSALVDINPFQEALIIMPKNHNGKWKIAFEVNQNNNIYQKAKYSHIDKVKILVDGEGCIMGMDDKDNFIELKSVGSCRAYQHRNILLV